MGLITSLSTENRQRLEAIATDKFHQLGLKVYQPLSAGVLAKYFQAKIFTTETVPNAEPEQIKILCDSDNWSAGIIRKDPLWIVHNSRHAATRQESNLMHEFAHIILKHEMVGYDPKTGLPQRRQQDEDEAVYLGGCLQIPRRGLLWAVQKKMTIPQIALHFNASEEMVKFRINVSGIYLV
ncbi:MAG TPA: Zn peptidase [Cyanobacteria bacterium UBA11149]|nr:Zn peptidase [Cyanobacteria bacterium UBA11367]HBE56271.1 Zn peptidase [Cyanobacteria bacterium UBA11366]HBK65051.1 Zn peptidase [Cyanobacteria bacterium UBA11166]HBR75998.1 Zn peptidase [Cyanobacteria bacterium UBA11159]HBS72623.1 Zn peptidase [Cyanobacteria bacterium UBA11153]HBW88706.1 Zn peptidase [Cyanobacteria bacterium UBA11149]HCA96779.1 Zn peptidase [Cyanobacteria bacterium UBA9226]